MTRKPEGWPCSVVMCLTTSEYTVTGSGPPEQAAPARRVSARVEARITGQSSTRRGAPGRYTWAVPRRGTSPPSSRGPGYRPFKAATRVRIPLGARNRIAGPVEQSGRARHPVKVEVAGSNPVRPAPAPGRRRSGEVAQLAEHAAENRGVGGSNPSLATALTWVNVPRLTDRFDLLGHDAGPPRRPVPEGGRPHALVTTEPRGRSSARRQLLARRARGEHRCGLDPRLGAGRARPRRPVGRSRRSARPDAPGVREPQGDPRGQRRLVRRCGQDHDLPHHARRPRRDAGGPGRVPARGAAGEHRGPDLGPRAARGADRGGRDRGGAAMTTVAVLGLGAMGRAIAASHRSFPEAPLAQAEEPINDRKRSASGRRGNRPPTPRLTSITPRVL